MTRPTIDDLEMLNPMELAELLLAEVQMDSPDIQFIQDLIYVGCPIDAKNKLGQRALHFAACGKLEVVKFLVSNGAQVDVGDNWGRTALHVAAHWGQLEIVEYLISLGTDINVISNNGHTAMDYALRGGYAEMINFFISISNQTFLSSDLV